MFQFLWATLFFTITILNSVAQEFLEDADQNRIETANVLLANHKYFEAIPFFVDEINQNKKNSNTEINFKLAECYRNVRMYQLAAKEYKKVLRKDINKFPLSLFYYAEMMSATENIQDAIIYYTRFINETDFDFIFTNLAIEQIKTLTHYLEQNYSQKELAVEPYAFIEKEKNSLLNGYELNDTLWFCKRIEINQTKNIETNNLKGRYSSFYADRLFFATKHKSGKWNKPFEYPLNLPNEFASVNSFTKTPFGFYLSICYENGQENCNIFKLSATQDFKQSKLEKLGTPINMDKSDTKHPSYAEINDIPYLFFASNRNENTFNIYCVDLAKMEIISNLAEINSKKNDISPFYNSLDETLYFSSERAGGFGYFDIYRATGNPVKGFSAPTLLNFPINTTADEMFYMALNDTINQGIIVSNRTNSTHSPKAETHINALYLIKKNNTIDKERKLIFSGTIVDEATNNPVISKIIIKDADNGFILNSIKTNTEGIFNIETPTDKKLLIEIESPNYLFFREQLIINIDELFLKRAEREYYLTAIYKGAKMILRDINFETGSAQLTDDSYPALMQISEYLKNNPNLKIEIAGHTDDTGTPEMNISLSLSRAQSVADYLIKSNIAPNNIEVKGYGYNEPIIKGKSKEARYINRRVELRVK